jgi:hypothetical protein
MTEKGIFKMGLIILTLDCGPFWTDPELLFESKKLSLALQGLLRG